MNLNTHHYFAESDGNNKNAQRHKRKIMSNNPRV